jgi:hypothetical protein
MNSSLQSPVLSDEEALRLAIARSLASTLTTDGAPHSSAEQENAAPVLATSPCPPKAWTAKAGPMKQASGGLALYLARDENWGGVVGPSASSPLALAPHRASAKRAGGHANLESSPSHEVLMMYPEDDEGEYEVIMVGERSPLALDLARPSAMDITFPLRIGECTVLAYSMIKGSDVLKVGDHVLLAMQAPASSPNGHHPPSLAPKTWSPSYRGPLSHKRLKPNKSAPEIVRLYRSRDGLEVGKLEAEHSTLFANLLGRGLVVLAADVLFAPERLTLMSEMFVSVTVSLTRTAFESPLVEVALDEEEEDEQQQRRALLSALFLKLGMPLLHTGGRAPRPLAGLAQSQELPLEDSNLTGADLSAIYRKAADLRPRHGSLQAASGLLIQLRPYQEAALAFLVSKEKCTLHGQTLSPTWSRYEGAGGVPIRPQTFYYNSFSGELAATPRLEKPCLGGILADEMGLGKTVVCLSLIHTHRMGGPQGAKGAEAPIHCPSTLVICPLNVMTQWRDEVSKCFSPGILSVELYYGTERRREREAWADIVLTYGTLSREAEADLVGHSPLYTTHWYRVVLDEAHYIKDASTKVAKACFRLSARMRWAVTGTPIVNRIDDLFALLHFLRVEPWGSFSYFNAFVCQPFQLKRGKALEALQTILESLVLRYVCPH